MVITLVFSAPLHPGSTVPPWPTCAFEPGRFRLSFHDKVDSWGIFDEILLWKPFDALTTQTTTCFWTRTVQWWALRWFYHQVPAGIPWYTLWYLKRGNGKSTIYRWFSRHFHSCGTSPASHVWLLEGSSGCKPKNIYLVGWHLPCNVDQSWSQLSIKNLHPTPRLRWIVWPGATIGTGFRFENCREYHPDHPNWQLDPGKIAKV